MSLGFERELLTPCGITPLLDFKAYRLKMLPHDIRKLASPGSRQEGGTPVGDTKIKGYTFR